MLFVLRSRLLLAASQTHRSFGECILTRKGYPKLKMASCSSSDDEIALAPVFVLSHVPRLAEILSEKVLLGVQIKPIDVSDISEKEPEFSEEKINSFKDAEIMVCDGNLLAKVYQKLPSLRWAHCTYAGVDYLFKEFTDEPNFALTRHSGDAFCGMMAEYVMCHLINCERKARMVYSNQNEKIWSQDGKIRNYRTLRELTITLLGVGKMASKIAELLVLQGATVNGFARNARPSGQLGDFERISTNLEDLLSDADYVVNTLPSTPLTRGILNPSVLEKCTKNPCFINVGRGDVIKENVLVEALRTGRLSGAVLDVFETEPLPESSELWGMPQVIITPHVAAVSKAEDIAEEFNNVLSSYIDGLENLTGLKNQVNWSEGY